MLFASAPEIDKQVNKINSGLGVAHNGGRDSFVCTSSPFNLQKIKNDLNLKKSLLATMKTELQKAQQIHAQSSQQYPLYDLDLGKFSEKVMQLTDRWQKIDKQIDFRCVSILARVLPIRWFKCH